MANQPKLKTRREFIRQSAIITSAFPFLFSCGQSPGSAKTAFDKDAIKAFRKNFRGQIFVPGDANYEFKRQAGYRNPDLDKHPTIIATCKDEQDVLRSLEFAQQHQWEIAVRSGNHSNMGWGTVEKGIVIDLSQMKSIAVNAGMKSCIVSTGATAAEILTATAPYGLAPVLGECGTVGSGLVLGGGLGWLSGKYGATCDNLLNARIATAGLQTIKAGSNINQDLFWAIKGGGGNFGIATSFEYKLHPVKEILGGRFTYPFHQARSILRFFNEFMATAPDDLQAECFLTNKECRVRFVYFGDLNNGELLLNKFRLFTRPEKESIKRRPFSEVYSMDPGGNITIESYTSNKGCYIQQMSDEAIDYVLECIHRTPRSCNIFFVFNHYMHGEVCRVPPGNTAFELRQPGAVHLVFFITWQNPADAAACLEWQTEAYDHLQNTYSGGRIYTNYMSVEGGANAEAVFGSSFQRLKQIKKKFDPGNIFHLNQNIHPS